VEKKIAHAAVGYMFGKSKKLVLALSLAGLMGLGDAAFHNGIGYMNAWTLKLESRLFDQVPAEDAGQHCAEGRKNRQAPR
jgi:hypothetical protein